jgi:histone deacetylase 6
MGVLDVNIPEHITMPDESPSRSDSNTEQARREAEKLANYLWENYIEPYDHEQIFFIGIGNAFHGVVKLLTEKGLYLNHQPSVGTDKLSIEEVYQRVGGVVAFIGNNPVRPVHSTDNPYLSRWYIANSIVFVSYTHSLWNGDRKTSKRYGKLQKSPEKQLHDMIARHKEETFAFIQARSKPGGPKSETSSEVDLVNKEDIVMSLEK